MSGHSKWSKVKNQKAATDAKKGKLYTLFAKKIAVAVKDGRGLNQVLAQAKAASIPKDVIERALEKSKQNLENAHEVIYEGFFLNGLIAIIIPALTDNNARTSNEVRRILESHGARLGAPNSAMHLFNKLGHFYISSENEGAVSPSVGARRALPLLDLVLDSGAQDFREEDEQIEVITQIHDLEKVTEFFTSKGIEIEDKEIFYDPLNKVEISPADNEKLEALLDALFELDEVVNCFTNAN